MESFRGADAEKPGAAHNLREIWQSGIGELEKASVPDASYDARTLLQEAFGLDTARFVLLLNEGFDTAFPEQKEKADALHRYQKWISQRAMRIPLQQILGRASFYGFTFLVSQDVLCPRQDTEILVERVLKDLEKGDFPYSGETGMRCLDLCTGTGCIAIALAAHWPEQIPLESIVATDISGRALSLAKKNAERLLPSGVLEKLRFRQADLFGTMGESGEGMPQFDLIVSNPPYIPSAMLDSLAPEVRLYEPRLALDGGADGLRYVREIIAESHFLLPEGGGLYLEIDRDQAARVTAFLRENNFHSIKVCQDLAGQDRVIQAKR